MKYQTETKMDNEQKEALKAKVREKLAQVAKLNPQEKARMMAEAVKFSRSKNLIKEEELARMRTDKEFAAKIGHRSMVDMLSWEAMKELRK